MTTHRFWLWFTLSFCLMMHQSTHAEFTLGGVIQPAVHEQNQTLCAQIVKEFIQTLPDSYSPQQIAHALNLQLDSLGREMLGRGLDLSAYTYDKCEDAPYLKFARIPLWESAYVDLKPKIPLTLFFYVWPPEHIAKKIVVKHPPLKNDPRTNYYATHIHGHPLPCALAVLRGTLCQENYVAVKGYSFNVAQKKDDEIFQVGMTTFDDNSTPFIHRIVCRDQGIEPAISLHGYGAPTAKEVLNTFIANKDLYFYPYVLKENGELEYQNR